jgi:probable HAF family extracellular repeat protein
MHRRFGSAMARALALSLTLTIGITIPAQAAKYYEVKDLANNEEGRATGINSAGDVVMTTDRGGNNSYATLYSRGTWTTISYSLLCPEPGMEDNYCTDSSATGINGNRQITGYADAISCCVTPYLYRYDVKTGVTHKIPTLGGANFNALAVNGAGQVVGWSETTGGARHAFLWNGSATKDLGTLGGLRSEAYGTYATGQAVGCSTLPSGLRHPFLYQGGVMSDLGLPAGQTAGCAMSINANGVIVGNSGPRAWVRTSTGFTLIPLPTGAVSMTATHIANNGEVVGLYRTADATFGYVYAAGRVVTLNTAIPFDDFDILEAASNNLKGQIAATARGDAGDPVLLTPIVVRDETAPTLSYSGSWTRVASLLAFGGYVKSNSSGGSVSMTFTGRDVSVIGPLRVDGGSATVYLDGVNVGIANENAPVASPRQRLFVREWASVGTHTLRLVATSGAFNLDAITFAPK